MSCYCTMIKNLETPEVMKKLTQLYGARDGMLVRQTIRYTELIRRHENAFHQPEGLRLISAPGRAEIGGNHTDHNRGKVLTAAVNLDAVAAVTKRDDLCVNLYSEGYQPLSLDLSDLSMREDEKGTTAALIRGVAARMVQEGYRICGFDAAMTSDVKSGSGLSSSAAVEVLFCAIFDELCNNNVLTAEKRAIIAQYAENQYFGKPCGLLDQMASSVGGLCAIDFRDDEPTIRPIAYDFAEKGYTMVVVATGGSHDNLTDAYAAVPQEMHAIANALGSEQLRYVQPEVFFESIPKLREELRGTINADRAILRAAHFYNENRRVQNEVNALLSNDLPAFMHNIIESGRSSFCYLQNVYPDGTREELPLALMLAEKQLRGNGAWRVHGGGFAGTTLNFVPIGMLNSFVSCMEHTFGAHCCDILDVRPVGPVCLTVSE